MAGQAPKVIGLTLAIAAAATVALLGLPRLFSAVTGPEVELITLLKEAERDGLELAVWGGTLSGKKVHYQRMSVTVDAAARRAIVLATLDFTGELGLTQVSSLGVERIVFLSDGLSWKPESSLAPRLTGVVNALQRRRRALEAGDARMLVALTGSDAGSLGQEIDEWLALLERKLQVDAWYIRLERDDVSVREQYRMEGFGRDRPFRQAGPRLLHLEPAPESSPAPGGEFFFPKGLM